MHSSHQRHAHQRAQFNKIMREGLKEQLEQVLRLLTLTASRWESPIKEKKTGEGGPILVGKRKPRTQKP